MRSCRADLHIHTALSPCADREMLPDAIVRVARERGLAVIAICDHNSAGNVQAVMEAAATAHGGEPRVIPGIEITTREEVHVLGLFPEAEAALAVAAAVLSTLPDERFLAAASGYDLSAAVALVRRSGGLAVAAHLDRRAFSVLGQLGFLPEDVRFDAAEVSAAGVARHREEGLRHLGLPLITGSDAHALEEIGAAATVLEVEAPEFAELALALRGERGRRCRLA
jgi:predicted metal-dependent phosphoesterase TrpH